VARGPEGTVGTALGDPHDEPGPLQHLDVRGDRGECHLEWLGATKDTGGSDVVGSYSADAALGEFVEHLLASMVRLTW
jgi:hypothetical protein